MQDYSGNLNWAKWTLYTVLYLQSEWQQPKIFPFFGMLHIESALETTNHIKHIQTPHPTHISWETCVRLRNRSSKHMIIKGDLATSSRRRSLVPLRMAVLSARRSSRTVNHQIAVSAKQ